MEWKHLAILAIAVGVCQCILPPQTCERTWKKVGCFNDRVVPDRPLVNELVNIRDPTNPAWNGFLMEWAPPQYAKSLHALACECYRLTKERGHRYFGLQFWGECWSGPALNFHRDGPSTKCVNSAYQACDVESQIECVGKAFTNYIYDTHSEQKDKDPPIDGGWGGWGQWSLCGAKCDGGVRTRERFCDNPEPEHGGTECEGDESIEEACNEEECAEICTSKVEIGIILDASTSVTDANYKGMLKFVQDLTDEFVVSPTQVHFGALHYSWKAKLDFQISDTKFWTNEALKEKVKSIVYSYGGTRTDYALKLAEKKLFCATCGLREGVPKVLIVFTDGKSSSTSQPMSSASAYLKDTLGVHIISVGVTKFIDKQQLNDIASPGDPSDPTDTNVLLIDDFRYLTDKLNTLQKKACRKVPAA